MALRRATVQEGEENGNQLVRAGEVLRVIREMLQESETRIGEMIQESDTRILAQVREELQKALGSYQQSVPRAPNSLSQAFVSSCYELHFENEFPGTLYTGNKIESVDNTPIKIAIVDGSSKERIKSGPLSSIRIEILVLNGDFACDKEIWTEKEFIDSVVREREGKGKLLTRRFITLHAGIGNLGDIVFTDNSSWVRTGKFRLGAKSVQYSCTEERIRETVSGAFTVKDNRGKGTEKHHPPSLDDEVWRLEKIRKNGPFHQKLAAYGIRTVQDLLKFSVSNQDLHTMFGKKRSEAVLHHARECVLDHKHYMYTFSEHQIVLVFNSILEVVGAYFDGNKYQTSDSFSMSEKVSVEKLKLHAYENKDDMLDMDAPPSDFLPNPLVTVDAKNFPGSSSSDLQIPKVPVICKDRLDDQTISWHQDPMLMDILEGANQIFPLGQVHPLPQSFSPTMNSYQASGTFDGEQMQHAGLNVIDQHRRVHIPHSKWARVRDILQCRKSTRKLLSTRRSRVKRINWLKLKAFFKLGVSIRKQAEINRMMFDYLHDFPGPCELLV